MISIGHLINSRKKLNKWQFEITFYQQSYVEPEIYGIIFGFLKLTEMEVGKYLNQQKYRGFLISKLFKINFLKEYFNRLLNINFVIYQ